MEDASSADRSSLKGEEGLVYQQGRIKIATE